MWVDFFFIFSMYSHQINSKAQQQKSIQFRQKFFLSPTNAWMLAFVQFTIRKSSCYPVLPLAFSLSLPPFKYLLIIYVCRRIVWILNPFSPPFPSLHFTSNWKIYLCLLKYEFIPTPHFDAFCCIKAEALELSFVCTEAQEEHLKSIWKMYTCYLMGS